VTKLTFLYLE